MAPLKGTSEKGIDAAIITDLLSLAFDDNYDIAHAQYRRTIEAIETVWKMTGGTRQNGTNDQSVSVGKGALRQAVVDAIQIMPASFTWREVEKQIKSATPDLAIKRASLSSVLKRLEKDKEIILVAVGSGKRPSTYRRSG
jgi:hypothetical protein